MSLPLMYVQRLRVAQLRKFEQLELTDLAPGLNILAGPNGVGKSTLHRAVRAAFLDRYSSNATAADLLPLGNTGAAPTVEVDFVLQGVQHRLTKTFLKRKRCDLQAGGQTHSEEAAEDYLAQRLGFGFAARGSKADHWGVPGLLWVEQGADHARFTQSVGFAATHLHQALHAQSEHACSAGSLASTAGDGLIAQLEAELLQFIGKSGKPVGSYAQLLERIDALRSQVQEQQQQIEEYRNQVDELEVLQQQAQQDREQQLEAQWTQALAQARQKLVQAREMQLAHAQASEQLRHVDRQLQVMAQVLLQHQQRKEELQRRVRNIDSAQRAKEQAEQQHARAAQGYAQARSQQEQSLQTMQQAEQLRQRQQLVQRVHEQQVRVQQLDQAWSQARQVLEQLEQLAQQLPAQRVEKADLLQLRKHEEAVLRARMQHEAVATQLQFALPEGQRLLWQSATHGGQWQGQGQQWLTHATQLQLPGGGTLTITPGGEDVAAAAQRLQQAQQVLSQALQTLQLDSVAQAQTVLEQYQQVLAQQQLAQQLLQAHAPQGVDALKLQCQTAQQQLQQLQGELEALPQVEAGMDWQQAQAALRAAQAQCDEARHQEHDARQQLALAQQNLDNANQEHAVALHQLQDPGQQQRLQQAEHEAALLQAQRIQCEQQVAQYAQALEAVDVRFAEQDQQRLERSLAAHAQQVQQREVRMASLRAALEQAGAQGLEESCAQTQAALTHAQHSAADIAQRCEALQLLVERLKAKRVAALRRLQAPLEARMQHYLQLLLPGAQMELDAQLVPHVVLAQGQDSAARRVAGEVATLSYGTQEQMAIISRLAYADLLQDSGQPSLLILDDALVHSDAQRLSQMKRVLFDAAQRHQILLLTCKPQDWLDAGAPIRELPHSA
ncbi:AAA family ATPase [Comamonas sp.]